jgi:hypothetical protein
MKKRNLWPLGIVLTFVIFIGGTVGLIVLAASQKTDLVSADYYEREVNYQRHMDSLERANHLPKSASVQYEPRNQTIQVTLPLAHLVTAEGKVELYRPSAAGLDRTIPLQLDAGGTQRLDGSSLQPGLWRVRVTWNAEGQEFCVEEKIVILRKS